jgi:hypothetical protein
LLPFVLELRLPYLMPFFSQRMCEPLCLPALCINGAYRQPSFCHPPAHCPPACLLHVSLLSVVPYLYACLPSVGLLYICLPPVCMRSSACCSSSSTCLSLPALSLHVHLIPVSLPPPASLPAVCVSACVNGSLPSVCLLACMSAYRFGCPPAVGVSACCLYVCLSSLCLPVPIVVSAFHLCVCLPSMCLPAVLLLCTSLPYVPAFCLFLPDCLPHLSVLK